MKGFQILARVFAKYRGLPARLSETWDKSAEWYASHGRLPRKHDPVHGTGNESPVDHYLDYLDEFAAVNNPAACALHQSVDAEARRRFACQSESEQIETQSELRRALLKEYSDVAAALDECSFENALDEDLMRWDAELSQLIDKALHARRAVSAARQTNKTF